MVGINSEAYLDRINKNIIWLVTVIIYKLIQVGIKREPYLEREYDFVGYSINIQTRQSRNKEGVLSNEK